MHNNEEIRLKEVVVLLGGAGYVGSHAAYLLHQKGYSVVVVDSFVHHQPNVVTWGEVIRADIADVNLLRFLFSSYKVLGVMHFAGLIEVGESVKHPDRFYDNNVIKSFGVLNAMIASEVFPIVFSSSCAVYGIPQKTPMTELHPRAPISPYGNNKLAVEFALQDYAQAYGLRHVSLRYFNAAGALPGIGLGEYHKPETHAIPLLLRAMQNNQPFTVYGTDYATYDGTCIRDYIHVLDLADAHVKAFEYLLAGGDSVFLNLGSGHGYSVFELIKTAQAMFNKKITANDVARRPGDVPVLLADITKAQRILGWRPIKSDLLTILQSAWVWEEQRNQVSSIVQYASCV